MKQGEFSDTDSVSDAPGTRSTIVQRIYAGLFRLTGTRRRRMSRFVEIMAPDDQTSVIDLGGTLLNWTLIEARPRLTIVNSDPIHEGADYPDHVDFVLGDALSVRAEDGSTTPRYNVAYSNSVIEHLGSWDDQVRFAETARSIGDRLWVQTPAREFFFEHHMLVPFVHWMPESVQRKLVRFTPWAWLFRPSREMADGLIDELRLLTRREMGELFPDCEIVTVRWLGLPRSYIAVRS